MRRFCSLIPCLFVVAIAVGTGLCGCSQRDGVTLFVAASIADVAQEWQTDFVRQGGSMEFHSGGSTILAQQIIAGADADIFLSAGPTPAGRLQSEGLIARIDTAYVVNQVVMVVRPGLIPPRTLADLHDSRFQQIALADPASASAGEYARAGLEYAGLWNIVSERTVFTADVRATLLAVATGAADVGFVYATDAATVPDLATVNPRFAPARYALVMLGPETPAKVDCWDYLHSPRARAVLASHGFES